MSRVDHRNSFGEWSQGGSRATEGDGSNSRGFTTQERFKDMKRKGQRRSQQSRVRRVTISHQQTSTICVRASTTPSESPQLHDGMKELRKAERVQVVSETPLDTTNKRRLLWEEQRTERPKTPGRRRSRLARRAKESPLIKALSIGRRIC